MTGLWTRIFMGTVAVLVLQYTAASLILGENDLDSYELAGFTISNGFVYRALVDERGGMTDRVALSAVLADLHVPLCDLHVVDRLPTPPEQAVDIPIATDPDLDWEALCETHDLLRLVIDELPDLPPAYLFFIDDYRPIVAFQTDDRQAWLGIDPLGEAPQETDWGELLPFLAINALIAITLAWFVSGPLARRIGRLSTLSQELAAGQLERRSGDTGSDAIGILGTNFNSMADSLQRVIDDQRDLLRAVAHELRTPLARIGIAVGIAELNNPEVDAQMRSIQEDLQELEGLIAEIADYLRLEHGHQLQSEAVDLPAISTEVIHRELQDHQHLAVSVHADATPITIWGHPSSLKRCLGNIVRNAGRYARERIDITLSATDQQVHILIEDDGPGFPAAMLDQLTTAFVTTSAGRLGLGLALCRRIIELTKGELRLTGSEQTGGAAVHITLPRHQQR